MSEGEGSRRRYRLALSVAISLAALAVAAAHVSFPDLEIDAVTLGLLVVALIPWLAPFVESFEAPGGWKVKLRELEQRVEEKSREVGELAGRVEQLEGLVFHGEATEDEKERLSADLASFDSHLRQLGLGPVGELPSIRFDEEFTNAFYDPVGHQIVLGRVTVENRYLLFRLYAMHVLGTLQPEAMADPTDTGLTRGIADFVAADFIGEAAYRHTPKMRHLHNEGRLDELAPPVDGSFWDAAYEAGEVWGGTLWELRRLIGADRAAPLVVSAWSQVAGRVEHYVDTVLDSLGEAERPVAAELFARRGMSPAKQRAGRGGARRSRRN